MGTWTRSPAAGCDIVDGGFNDIVSSGPGNDRIDLAATADGGDGDDLLLRVQGSAQGGPGNDRIYNPGSGPLDGGSGFDSSEIDFTAFSVQLSLTIVVSDSGLTSSAPSLPPTNLAGASLEEWLFTMTDGVQNDVLDSRTYSGRVRFPQHQWQRPVPGRGGLRRR